MGPKEMFSLELEVQLPRRHELLDDLGRGLDPSLLVFGDQLLQHFDELLLEIAGEKLSTRVGLAI